jgi:hypothetical protein
MGRAAWPAVPQLVPCSRQPDFDGQGSGKHDGPVARPWQLKSRARNGGKDRLYFAGAIALGCELDAGGFDRRRRVVAGVHDVPLFVCYHCDRNGPDRRRVIHTPILHCSRGRNPSDLSDMVGGCVVAGLLCLRPPVDLVVWCGQTCPMLAGWKGVRA